MTSLPFSPEEFEERSSLIKAGLDERQLDALVVTRPENIFYASGYRAAHIAAMTSQLHALVVPATGAPRLIARALESETVKTQWTELPRLFRDHEDPYPLVEDILAETGSQHGRIGIEGNSMVVNQLDRLRAALPQASFTDVAGLVEGIAASPSPAEIACLRRSARLTNIGIETGFQAVREGVYPFEVIGRMHEAMYTAGQTDFDQSVVALWSGPGGGRMHDSNTTERIEAQDVVTIEIFGVDTQYRTTAQGSVYVGGEPPQAIRDAHSLVTDMHDEARAAVRAGVTTGEVFEAANRVYRRAKGQDYYRRVGGSVGLTLFATNLVKDGTQVLKPGAPLLIQALVDDPALVTCSSTVLVTDDGCEELTRPIAGLRAHS
jgi:Xaa-Pro dipeptidase